MQWWRAALAALSLAAAASGGSGGAGLEGGGGARGAGSKAVEQWQKGMLKMMGLKRRPRVDRAKVVIPEAMRNLYDQLSAGAPFLPDHQKTANTVRSFPHKESAIDRRFKGHNNFRFAFNVSVPDDEWLTAAELVISRDSVKLPTDSAQEYRHKVLVYDILKPGKRGGPRPVLRLLDSKSLRPERAGSVRLDVTGAAERWLWKPQENHGLLVHVVAPHPHERPHVRLRRSAGDSPAAWRARQPVLLAYTDDGRARASRAAAASRGDGPKSRQARAANRRPHRRKDGRDICQRRPLHVEFDDVGWQDWIVAPKGYNAHYCHGDCPFPLADHLNSTNHAIIQTMINSVNPSAVPKACCVPTDLSSISMLYLDEENKVLLKNYQDMSVVGCGCR